MWGVSFQIFITRLKAGTMLDIIECKNMHSTEALQENAFSTYRWILFYPSASYALLLG